MSDVQLYLLEIERDKDEARKIAEQSANKLATKQLKLIDLITSLEEYINNKDDGGIRAKSVSYLADVLQNIQPKVLSLQERRLLCDFILGRLEGDVDGIGASARALMALEQRGKWDAETAQRVMHTLLDHTSPLMQFKQQTERYPVIQLVDVLLAGYRDAMRELHERDGAFMPAFISYFSGEKDPRNLMIVFSLLRVPMAEWEVQASAQDLFEAVFNYFPITFKPPPNDPYGITAQDLKARLQACVAATSDFAPYAFPALLDKLDSTSVNTKRDTLHTIEACVAAYTPATVNLYSVALWDALKFEVLNVQEESLAEDALRALAAIAAKFQRGPDGPLNAFLRPVIKECNEHLEDAPTKQSAAAGRIIHAVAGASTAAADRLAKGTLPVLFALYHASESVAKRRGLLEVFNQLTKAYAEAQDARLGDNVVDDDSSDALPTFADDALAAMLRALANAPKPEVSFRLAALHGLAALVAIRGALSEKQTHGAIDAVCDVVLNEHIDGHGDIRAEAIAVLTQMAHAAPDAVRTQAVPAFMVRLPDVPPQPAAGNIEGEEGEIEAYVPALEAFAQLSREQQVFDTVVLRLKNKLNAARQQRAPASYQHALLLALLYAFTYGAPQQEDGRVRSTYFTDFAEPLMLLAREDEGNNTLSGEALGTIGRIANIILREQTVHFQSTVYNTHMGWLSLAAEGAAAADTGRPQALAPFTLYYYAALRPEVADAADILSLLRAHASYSLNSSRTDANLAIVSRHLSLLVNKFLEPKVLENSLQNAGIDIEALLASSADSHRVTAVFAVVKGLLVQGRSAALTTKYLALLLDALPRADAAFARRFAGLLAPDDILTRANHCVVSGLHKQRAFSQLAPRIVAAVAPATPASRAAKPRYLVALAGVLRCLPYGVVQPALGTLVPLLLQSLDLGGGSDAGNGDSGTAAAAAAAADITHADAQAAKAAALAVFESLLTHDAALANEHAASLISRLLSATTATPPLANVAAVRARALLCLALLPRQLPRPTVVPFRRPVVKRLLACLDDAKRNVRAEAVRCRGAWLALDDGDDDDT